jgi:membrane protease YdiL (CAAX protease family)
MFGNLFSNFYEELTYRGLIFAALLFALPNKWFAIFASGFIFTWSHTNQPLYLIIGTVLLGVGMAYPYYRTGNLLTPYLVHQISDMILDSLFSRLSL